MNLQFQLRSLPGPGGLQALLPALFGADSVRVDAPASALRCVVADAAAAGFEARVTAMFRQLGIEWQADPHAVDPDADDQLYSHADAVLTLIAPAEVALPADLLTQLHAWDLQLRGLRRLSSSAHTELAVELYLQGSTDVAARRPALATIANRWGVDLALALADSKRPRRRLVAFDMDSTLIRCEVIDELAVRAGVGDAVAAVTARAMRGELDFCASFRERMAKLRGLDRAALDVVADALPLMPGVETLIGTLRAQGHYTVILSGGFDYFARRLQALLGFHEIHANVLQIEDEALTGEVIGEIIDGGRKLALLGQVAAEQGFSMADTVAVGDGANDLPMISAAGLGVAFHAKPVVREQAPTVLTHCDLTGLLYLLGVPRD